MTPFTHPGGTGGQQDQDHGVVLNDQGEDYQQPISFMSRSSRIRSSGVVVLRRCPYTF